MTDTSPAFPIVDRPGTPDFFADGALALYISEGVMRVTFSRTEPDHQGGYHTLVTGRVAMPLEGARTLRDALTAFLARQDEGASPPPPPPAPIIPTDPAAF
jgi:hypothetical protein